MSACSCQESPERVEPAGDPVTTTGAPSAVPVSITLEVTGFRNDDGWLLIYLFDSDETFPGEYAEALRKMVCPIESQASTTELLDVPPGTYAISAIHDEDGNGELRTNFIGIPKEGVGSSNDPAPRMGPPRWEDARFELDADRSLSIELQYP